MDAINTNIDKSVAAQPQPSSHIRYSQIVKKRCVYIAAFAILLFLSFTYDIATGPGEYPLSEIWATLLNKAAISVQLEVIVWDHRMPIALMAVIVGIMLSLAGAQMQTILHNPLADPFTLGVASAASFGAASAIILGAGIPVASQYLVTTNAFVFAFGASLLLYFITRLRGVTTESMILIGIALMFTFSSLVSLLQYSSNETQLQQLIFWTMGSLGKATWNSLGLCFAVTALSCIFFYSKCWSMTALRMGDEKARSMGIPVERLRLQILLVISLLSALAVSFVGVIAFVGLVGPHIARMIVGEDQRFFLVTSGLSGALLMSLTSVVSKSIVPGIIYPIGIITSLIGIPFFVSLVLQTRSKNW